MGVTAPQLVKRKTFNFWLPSVAQEGLTLKESFFMVKQDKQGGNIIFMVNADVARFHFMKQLLIKR